MTNKILRKLNVVGVFTLALVLTGVLSTSTYILASTTSNFQQTINKGTLAVDIVDGSEVTVASPSVVMGASDFSFSCSSSTGTFGTASQQILVTNPSAANAGWTVSLAASNVSDLWTSATTSASFDYNNEAGAGCTGGQLAVDPSGGTLSNSPYANSNIALGSASAFASSVPSITLINAAAASLNVGKWTLQGVDVTQTIPAAQEAADDYNINMVVSIVAK